MPHQRHVECAGSEVRLGGVPDDETNRQVQGQCLELGPLHHRGRQVNAENVVSCHSHKNRERPGAAPQVDDGASGLSGSHAASRRDHAARTRSSLSP